MTYQIRVCALVRRGPDDVLVVRERIRGEERINLPGGIPHYGESLFEAVVREVLEETGYEVIPTEIAFIAERRLARWDDVELTICFSTDVIQASDRAPQSEVSSIGWLHQYSEKLISSVPEIANLPSKRPGRYISLIQARDVGGTEHRS